MGKRRLLKAAAQSRDPTLAGNIFCWAPFLSVQQLCKIMSYNDDFWHTVQMTMRISSSASANLDWLTPIAMTPIRRPSSGACSHCRCYQSLTRHAYVGSTTTSTADSSSCKQSVMVAHSSDLHTDATDSDSDSPDDGQANADAGVDTGAATGGRHLYFNWWHRWSLIEIFVC